MLQQLTSWLLCLKAYAANTIVEWPLWWICGVSSMPDILILRCFSSSIGKFLSLWLFSQGLERNVLYNYCILLALGDFCTQLNSRTAYSHAPLEIVHSYLFLHFKMKYVTHSPFWTHVTFNQCSFVPCSFPLQLLAKLDIKFQLSPPIIW